MEKNPAFGRPNWFSYFILVLAGLIAVFPVFWIFATSIKPRAEVLSPTLTILPQTPTLENYSHVLNMQNGGFWQWMFNSVFIIIHAEATGEF